MEGAFITQTHDANPFLICQVFQNKTHEDVCLDQTLHNQQGSKNKFRCL